MAEADDATIGKVVDGISNTLGLGNRSDAATKRLAHFLKWYASDAAAAPRRAEVTLTGTLGFDDFDNMSLTLPDGEVIDLGEVTRTTTKGVKIKGID